MYAQVLCTIEPARLHRWVSQLAFGELQLFGRRRVAAVAVESLGWDCYEQNILWQLLRAELQSYNDSEPIVDVVAAVMRAIESSTSHPEAAEGLIFLLASVVPTSQLVSCVVGIRELADMPFLSARVLTQWSQVSCEPLAQAIAAAVQCEDAKKQGWVRKVLQHLVRWLEQTQRISIKSGMALLCTGHDEMWHSLEKIGAEHELSELSATLNEQRRKCLSDQVESCSLELMN